MREMNIHLVLGPVAEAIHQAIFDEPLPRGNTIERALYLQAAEAGLRAGVAAWKEIEATPREPALHHFQPHRKWPWFCAACGYPPHETLKHYTAQAIEARRAETRSGSVHESAVAEGHAPDGIGNPPTPTTKTAEDHSEEQP